MTPKEIASELIDSYSIFYGGTQKWEAKSHAFKVLHIMALANEMSYRQYYEIAKEIDAI